jgi:predicted nuclease of predicted toxin-antitoxin system
MNLSPEWVPLLKSSGFDACHWSDIGAPNALDVEIMQWARDNQSVVFTHDLDFGIILAHTKSDGPSVLQVRTQNVSPNHMGNTIITVLTTYADVIAAGALVTLDEARSRIRILPI